MQKNYIKRAALDMIILFCNKLFFTYESPAMRGQLQRNLVLRLLLFRAAEIVAHALVLTFIICTDIPPSIFFM